MDSQILSSSSLAAASAEEAGPSTQSSPGSEPVKPAAEPVKAVIVGNGYPFETKAQIRSRIESEPAFVRTCLLILDGRQTVDEHDEKTTKYRNRRGWMSSHAVNGTKLATKVANDEPLDAEEQAKATEMVSRYTKQLAAHFRNVALAIGDPDLAAKARVFGIGA